LFGLCFNNFLKFGPRASINISEVLGPSILEIIFGKPAAISFYSDRFSLATTSELEFWLIDKL
jgi:hypothetical protein